MKRYYKLVGLKDDLFIDLNKVECIKYNKEDKHKTILWVHTERNLYSIEAKMINVISFEERLIETRTRS